MMFVVVDWLIGCSGDRSDSLLSLFPGNNDSYSFAMVKNRRPLNFVNGGPYYP